MNFYLDTDIFLALIKEKDRFKTAAKKFLSKNKNHKFFTSTISCLEVWFYLYKHNMVKEALDAIRAIKAICKIINDDIVALENSIVLAEHHKLSPTDVLHATMAMNYDAIVSTDSSFDKVHGLKRINFLKN